MTVSVDLTQLEAVKDFSFFLDALKDPKGLSEKLKQVSDLTEEYKRVLGVVQTKEQADAYLENAKTTVAGWGKEQDEKDAAFEVRVAKSNKDIKEKQQQVQDSLNAASVSRAEAADDAREKDSVLEEAVAVRKQAEDLQTQVEVKLKELQNKEQELDSKLATVNKMLGV